MTSGSEVYPWLTWSRELAKRYKRYYFLALCAEDYAEGLPEHIERDCRDKSPFGNSPRARVHGSCRYRRSRYPRLAPTVRESFGLVDPCDRENERVRRAG
jgi:hypothetical protein